MNKSWTEQQRKAATRRFQARLKSLLEENGLSHSGLANVLGIGRAVVRSWLSVHNPVDPEAVHLYALARLFEKPMAWLYPGPSYQIVNVELPHSLHARLLQCAKALGLSPEEVIIIALREKAGVVGKEASHAS